jgi:hypothetical protein
LSSSREKLRAEFIGEQNIVNFEETKVLVFATAVKTKPGAGRHSLPLVSENALNAVVCAKDPLAALVCVRPLGVDRSPKSPEPRGEKKGNYSGERFVSPSRGPPPGPTPITRRWRWFASLPQSRLRPVVPLLVLARGLNEFCAIMGALSLPSSSAPLVLSRAVCGHRVVLVPCQLPPCFWFLCPLYASSAGAGRARFPVHGAVKQQSSGI